MNKSTVSLYLSDELIREVEEAYDGGSRSEKMRKTIKAGLGPGSESENGDESEISELKEQVKSNRFNIERVEAEMGDIKDALK